MGFGFSNSTPACSDFVPVFLLGHVPAREALSLFPPSVHFLFMFRFSEELFAHTSRSSAIFAWTLIRVDESWAWGKWVLKINQLFWTPLLPCFTVFKVFPANITLHLLTNPVHKLFNWPWVIIISPPCLFIPSLKLSSPGWPACWQRSFATWYLFHLVRWMPSFPQSVERL